MPAQALKDYYKILEVPAEATQEQIKKSYRALAFQYHPDTNPDSQYAIAHFLEIQEAYSVLSDHQKRKKYDEERWLSGMSKRAKDQVAVTPQWIYREAKKLHQHMDTVDTYRMNHRALYDYIMLLLQDSHIAILEQSDDHEQDLLIVREILQSTRHLRYEYMQAVAPTLQQLSQQDAKMTSNILSQVMTSRHRKQWASFLPYFIAIISVTLCIAMYLYSRRQ